VADGDLALFDGATGKAIKGGRGAISHLGIGTAPDATDTDTSNRLIVRGNRALFHAIPAAETPGSGDVKVQVSKEAAGNTAAWFFATDFQPRGEIGFIADDDELRIKVFDGTGWHEGISVVRATGQVKIGGAPLGTAALKSTGASGDAVPLLNAANTWSAQLTVEYASAALVLSSAIGAGFARLRHSIDSRQSTFEQVSVSGAANFLFDAVVQDGTSTAAVTYFRNTNTTGDRRLIVHRGDGTNTADHVVYAGGGYVCGNPSGGNKGIGAINAQAIYDDNSLLTCMALAREFRERGEVDVGKWDALDPVGREHRTARLFKAMIDSGFDPRDPEQYFARMQADEALPGMPVQADWRHNELSMGEMFSRKWLALEMLAIVANVMWAKLKEHEARLATLSSRA
jgi:hypothetical protein